MSYRVVDDTSRRVIDVAIVLLVGLRGCSDQAAFDELVRVVHQTGIGIGRLAGGLVRWPADRHPQSMSRRSPYGVT